MLQTFKSPKCILICSGIEKANVFTIRNVVDIDKLHRFIKKTKPTRITVAGAGFIGIEVVENLVLAGYNVTLVQSPPQILNQIDDDMVQRLHKEVIDHGVELILGDRVSAFDSNRVILKSCKVIESEVVIMSIGITPATELAE